MNILVIGSDPRIFDENSESFLRIREYAGLFGEYHIISRAGRRAKPARHGNLFLWPAYSRFPLFWLWRAFRSGRMITRKYRIDVIDAQDAGECGLVAFLVARLSRCPLRLQIHTDIMSMWYRAASWKEHARYHIARFLIPRADCVRVVSERIRSSLLRSRLIRDPSRIAVLPIFTDVSKFISAVSDSEIERRFKNYDFRMIAVGRFVDKEKNFSMLIDVMREFIKICPNALLVIVGEGPDRGNYESRIRNYGLKKNVIIEPWRNDLASFYPLFNLFLLSSNYEGWGRVVIEAMAAGLPVLMTDVGLAGEVVKDQENGFVVPVGDAHAFLQAIETLYKDPQKRKRLAAIACQTAKNLKPAIHTEYLTRYRQCFESCVFPPAAA